LLTIKEINWLKLFKEIIPGNIENHPKPINSKCRAEILIVKAVVAYNCHSPSEAKADGCKITV
jgi:hypothetical protein